MKEVDIADWKLRVDPKRTRQVLAGVSSDAENCGCATDRNFIAARPGCFPKEFLQLLDLLGIDPTKDAHCCHMVKKRETGLHLYDIEYYFAGQVIREAEDKTTTTVIGDSFCYAVGADTGYRKQQFGDGFLVLICYPEIPWVLSEDEVDVPITDASPSLFTRVKGWLKK
jgi:hypothetical protein